MVTDESDDGQSSRAALRRLPPEKRVPLILEAALVEFAERGYGGARTAAIAARAGVTRGLVHHYFPSKAELFRAMVRSYMQSALSNAERDLSAPSVSAWDLIQSIWEAGYGQIEQPGNQHHWTKLIVSESEQFPELAEFYKEEVLKPGVDLVRRVLRIGAASGEFRPEVAEMPYLAEVLMAPTMMTRIWRLILGDADAPDPKGMLAASLDMLRPALRAPTALEADRKQVP